MRNVRVLSAALATLVALAALAGCKEPQPLTVAHFLENEVALYGTLARCDRDPGMVSDAECRNARAAAERIAAIEERAARRTREQAFESARAEYRAQLDRERELRLRAEAEAHAARLRALVESVERAAEESRDTTTDSPAPAPQTPARE